MTILKTPAKISVKEVETEITSTYVVLERKVLQAKYWNYDGGWDEIVKYLKKKGYEIVCVDKHALFGNKNFMNAVAKNVIQRQERTLDQTIATINGAEFFIGLGSDYHGLHGR